MKNLFTILLLVSFLIIIATGCSDDKNDSNPTESNGDQTSDVSELGGYPAPSGIMTDEVNGVMATISVEVATAPGFPSVSTTIAFATFANGADAGSVSVNNNTLGKNTESGSTFYMVPSPSNPQQQISNVSFNGSAHSWSVAGGNGVPALSGSVNSPSSFTLESPENNASVSKSAGFDVTWTSDRSANAKFLVMVTQANNGETFMTDELDDDGSYTVSSSSLSNLSGECLLQVVKYTYNSVSADGKSYVMISEIVQNATITVN